MAEYKKFTEKFTNLDTAVRKGSNPQSTETPVALIKHALRRCNNLRVLDETLRAIANIKGGMLLQHDLYKDEKCLGFAKKVVKGWESMQERSHRLGMEMLSDYAEKKEVMEAGDQRRDAKREAMETQLCGNPKVNVQSMVVNNFTMSQIHLQARHRSIKTKGLKMVALVKKMQEKDLQDSYFKEAFVVPASFGARGKKCKADDSQREVDKEESDSDKDSGSESGSDSDSDS